MENILQIRKELTDTLLNRAKSVSGDEYNAIKAAIANIQRSYKDPKLQIMIMKQMR